MRGTEESPEEVCEHVCVCQVSICAGTHAPEWVSVFAPFMYFSGVF